MRLLNVHSREFREFHSADIPKYAIASHRWRAGDEASYKDVWKGRNTQKSGHQKVIRFADYVKAHVAAVDWLWIDTCCIDVRSSQEVSEAVNSMFRWYSNAEVCLAYLPDVNLSDANQFRQSEWFRRGWTLQELLAPSLVIFLTAEWQVIGHKSSNQHSEVASSIDIGWPLNPVIASITNIPEQILRDYGQSKSLSVQERLQWVTGRRTTREEDLSYCLIGIFDVAIGANYGEGGDKARRRLLKEISADEDVSRVTQSDASAEARMPDLPDRGEAREDVSRVTQSHASAETRMPDLLDRGGAREYPLGDRDVSDKVMEGLHFPQMDERRNHIHTAYEGTCQWALLSTATTDVRWDNFLMWLSDPQSVSRIYWINAKPGAGKSSLVRFLDEQLESDRHMCPWIQDAHVVQAQYYFWSPGDLLQKTINGLLRTILYQLLDELPNLLQSCVPSHKLTVASSGAPATVPWTDSELRECLRRLLLSAPFSVKILLLIDGLDEIDGGDDAQENLINLLKEIAGRPNVKICVSSRGWPIFRDAFATCPQLRLEDLNSRDIEEYVRGELGNQPRYRQMLEHDPQASDLVRQITSKANGVFLWTRLVVKELLRSLRDGDSYPMLHRILHHEIPSTLGAYFRRIMEVIEPHHRREAGILLQIALHREDEFTSLHSLRLLDLIFIADADRDFALGDEWETYGSAFENTATLIYTLNTTLRRLLSRCRGLLECYFELSSSASDSEDEAYVMDDDWIDRASSGIPPSTAIETLPDTLIALLHDRKGFAFEIKVDFMHRSLRDFLLEPDSQQILHSYSEGPFDSRGYLRNARLTETLMLQRAGLQPERALGLASYCISTMSLPWFRDDPRNFLFASRLEFLLNFLRSGMAKAQVHWYINHSFQAWSAEMSSFVSLAVDFALTGYLARVLTTNMVQEKRGRPLLDHALRPRFAKFSLTESPYRFANQYPLPELVRALLSLGANPNQVVGGCSLWPLFLSSVVDHRNAYMKSESEAMACTLSLTAMIEGGAAASLDTWNLFLCTDYGIPNHGLARYVSSSAAWGTNRWREILSDDQTSLVDQQTVSILDVLEAMRSMFGRRIDIVLDTARRRLSA